MGESCWHSGVFSISAVSVPTGVKRIRTQILPAPSAEDASTAGMPQPCDAHAVADVEFVAGILPERHDLGHHLVPGDHALPVHRQIPFGDMQIGATHAAGAYRDEEFTGRGRRDWYRHALQ